MILLNVIWVQVALETKRVNFQVQFVENFNFFFEEWLNHRLAVDVSNDRSLINLSVAQYFTIVKVLNVADILLTVGLEAAIEVFLIWRHTQIRLISIAGDSTTLDPLGLRKFLLNVTVDRVKSVSSALILIRWREMLIVKQVIVLLVQA